MAKISQREKILLGYGSSNSNSMSNSSSRRNSEVDFSDVFGGPPRCSTQEYYQYEDDDSINCIDDDNDIDNDNDNDNNSGDGSRVSLFGLEKPVFGEQVGGRRRHTSEDFYGDIFGGDQPLLSCSLSTSVPMPGRNPFSSAPGSRNMSPSRQMYPAAEPSAAPSKSSLPGRTMSPDTLTSTSLNQSSKLSGRSFSRFNQTSQNHSALHDDTPSSYQPSTLSREVSIDGKESTSDRNLDGADYEGEFIINSKDSEVHNKNIQFHFSMYKWPSKGVPIVMSSRKRSTSRSKERIKSTERYLSTSEGISSAYLVMETHKGDVTVNESLSSSKRRVPSTSQRERDLKNEDTNVRVMSVECNSDNEVGEAPSDGLEGTEKVSHLSQKSSEAVADDFSQKKSLKKTKSNMKSLGSLFGEEKKGKKKATTEKGGKKNKVNETKKPSMNDSLSSNINKGKVHSLNTGERETDDISSYIVNNSKVHKSSTGEKVNDDISSNNVNKSKVHMSTGAKDDICKGDGSGKVKDFVKIFNQDTTSTTKSNVVGKSRSWRWRSTTNFEAEKEVDILPAKNHDDMHASYVNLEKTWSETIEVIDEDSFLSEEQVFMVDGNDRVADTTTSASNNEPNIDGIGVSATKNETNSVDDILDSGMIQDIDTQIATESQEETKSYERKVRQWSKGKEGNIRALLSTMQYVLWSNSGWKPIPLVDIIEANAVKKAYQRALLCLHPDKLQQKGAAPYQKLIAEKVFDILQESWDQFNAIGLLS
ncbi:J domain-containing protein required for chloroplast accumulation response 1-like [Chenopodium quinoa]|uniref:J domain-containing protein required for chloroplast accumulation response 1-like n=1 Tax=Chenopodium quinoa TaxID=63459 RepID=UPI000B76D5C7|nr:J domain-containing protein required for chloroplast accumulation response 1-like [Chenopodium quinoa]